MNLPVRRYSVVDVSDSPHLHKCESGFIFSIVSYDECKTLEGSVRWFRNTEVPTKGTCCHKDLELKVQIGDEPHVYVSVAFCLSALLLTLGSPFSLQNLCKENKYVRAASVDGRGCSLKPGNFAWRPNAPKRPSVPDNNLCLSRPMDYARFGNTPGICYCKLRVS